MPCGEVRRHAGHARGGSSGTGTVRVLQGWVLPAPGAKLTQPRECPHVVRTVNQCRAQHLLCRVDVCGRRSSSCKCGQLSAQQTASHRIHGAAPNTSAAASCVSKCRHRSVAVCAPRRDGRWTRLRWASGNLPSLWQMGVGPGPMRGVGWGWDRSAARRRSRPAPVECQNRVVVTCTSLGRFVPFRGLALEGCARRQINLTHRFQHESFQNAIHESHGAEPLPRLPRRPHAEPPWLESASPTTTSQNGSFSAAHLL
jgi:hypothetical protein